MCVRHHVHACGSLFIIKRVQGPGHKAPTLAQREALLLQGTAGATQGLCTSHRPPHSGRVERKYTPISWVLSTVGEPCVGIGGDQAGLLRAENATKHCRALLSIVSGWDEHRAGISAHHHRTHQPTKPGYWSLGKWWGMGGNGDGNGDGG